MSNEYDSEPIRGLPGNLPDGETIVWQGGPSFASLAKRALHVPLVAGYFVVLTAWGAITAATDGVPLAQAATGLAITAAVGVLAVVLLAFYAWLAARTTVYTITTRRVVLRFGVALPKCINLPFAQVAGAGLQVHADDTGDLPLQLEAGARMGYLTLWPHARPWRVSSPEPMLRSVAQPDHVARLLSTALAEAVSGQREAIVESTVASNVFAIERSIAA